MMFLQLQLRLALLLGLFFAAAACLAHAAGAAEVSASLSSREAFVGAPVTLTIEISDAEADVEPTLADVDGLQIRSLGVPSRSVQRTIINGRRSDRTSVQYAWQVTPEREGTFTIPSIEVEVDGTTHTTDPLRLVATRSETGDLLFVEVRGQDERVYVGQPLRLNLKIWLRPYRDRQHDLTLSPSNMWNAISLQGSRWAAFAEPLQRMLDNRQQPAGREVLRTTSDGQQRAYYLYEIETALYPRRPGEVDPGGVRIVVNYPTALGRSRDPFDAMFDSGFPFSDGAPFSRSALQVAATRPVVAEAAVEPLQVVPLPSAGQPDDFRGAVGQYQIITQATPTSVQAGDPITFNIGIHGDGPMELVQAPPLDQYAPLTDDFKVPDEPLAGIVDGPVKVFSVSIRPRRAGVTQIPAIPFTYFDPAAEKYVTIHSDPIDVQVEPAENLAMDAIVASPPAEGGPAGSRASPLAAPQAEAGPQMMIDTGAAVLQSKAQADYLPLALTLLLPPLAFGGVALGKLAWPRLVTAGRRRATARIAAAQDGAELRDAVRAAVDDALPGHRTGSLTRPEIISLLRRSGRDAEAAEIDRVLTACEQWLYAGSADAPLDQLKQQAQAAVRELWRHRRSSPRDLGRGRPVAAVTHTTVVLALLVGGGPGLTFVSAGPLRVAAAANDRHRSGEAVLQLSHEQRLRIFHEANRAYQRGLQSEAIDAGEAKQAFSEAAAKYRTLIDAGIRNDRLYVNLGNAYLQAGQRGRAVASYLHALRIDPANRQARANLLHVQRPVTTADEQPTVFSAAADWLRQTAVHMVPHRVWLIVASAAWVAFWGGAVWRLFGILAYGRAAAAVLLLTVAVCFALWGGVEAERWTARAVAVEQAVVRAHDGEAFPELPQSPVPEGAVLELVEDRGEWLHVQLPDGSSGWIASTQAEVVGPVVGR